MPFDDDRGGSPPRRYVTIPNHENWFYRGILGGATIMGIIGLIMRYTILPDVMIRTDIAIAGLIALSLGLGVISLLLVLISPKKVKWPI